MLGRLFPNHGDRTKISDAVGVGVDVVSRWMSGATKPDPQRRGRLEELYGINWRLWDELAEPARAISPPDSDVGAVEPTADTEPAPSKAANQ